MRKTGMLLILVFAFCLLLSDFEEDIRQGRIYFAKGYYREALAIAEQVVEKYPYNAKGYHLLGDAWFKIGKKKPAMEAFLNAVKYDPEDAEAYLKIGGLYYLNQDIDKAVEYVKKAADLGDKRAINVLKQYEEHKKQNP